MKRLAAILPVLVVALLTQACAGAGGRKVAAEFTDIGDLVTLANVQQSDAVVGSVRDIDLIDRDGHWYARVTMKVDPGTRVPEGTRAVVRSTSLLGEKYVDLIPPSNDAPELPDGAVLPASSNAKAAELEAVFSQLGALLQSGGLEDLAKITSASAAILEGQSDEFGRVLDGTAKLIASIRSQKDALASGIADLASASATLKGRTQTLSRALDVSDDALSIVASQQSELDDLVVALDKLGKPLAQLTREHGDDVDAQLKALNKIVPELYKVRGTLEAAVKKLPAFTKLFAASAPGDYFQLDIFVAALPIGTPTSGPAGVARLRNLFTGAAL